MDKSDPTIQKALSRLTWPLRLTRLGLIAEHLVRAFWPLWTVGLVVLSALMLGFHETIGVETVWLAALGAIAAAAKSLWYGIRRFRWPSAEDAQVTLDATLPGRPIAALEDTQAIGAGDAASRQVWDAHVARMAERAKAAKAAAPDLKLSQRDPYALRYVALLAFLMAGLFGSLWRASSITEMGLPTGEALAAGPAWEGWIEPPSYTGKPSLYLNDIDRSLIVVPEGSDITLRLYGEVGSLAVGETVSGRNGELPPASEPSQTFRAAQSGRVEITGEGGTGWNITVLEDDTPTIELTGPLERSAGGEFRQPFAAADDYGVVSGRAEIILDLPRVDRRHGLVAEPEPRDTVMLDLPLTISGDRARFDETLIDDLAEHPWAGLPITVQLFAEDAAGQSGETPASETILPARRFFDPLASAIVEQRRDLLWSRTNAPRVAAILRAVSHMPQDIFRSETAYLKLRFAIKRLETAFTYASVSTELQEEIAQALWDIAIDIGEGDLSNALERLRRAQDRLSDAIQNGATDAEIAELMQELREAMQDYMRQLAEQGGEQGDNQQAQNQEMQEITGDQLQEMLDRLQELMEQGRTEEAQALLDQLRQMMENMQVAEGQQGQGQQSAGEQAMEGLAETLRDQQGLSDDSFRDLQEQFNQGGQPQQQPGQQGQQGQEGQQGQQGQPGQGQGQQPGQNGERRLGSNGPGGEQSLAERQQALRDRLAQQQRNLPGSGTPEGDAARDALDRAGRAMEGAEEALRDDDFAEAIDNQSEAIEALREGMRELGEAMAQNQQAGQQGDAANRSDQMGQRDPLGREAGRNGATGTDEELLQSEDVYRRARELLDEIRRRSGDQTRPDAELDYLKRLLDRF
ncbi:MAG: TIGR02302 family protein [Alphaproteobacteria bacterium]|nr:TIGR02302 family protein [Alphaproteobacteria bacterium]